MVWQKSLLWRKMPYLLYLLNCPFQVLPQLLTLTDQAHIMLVTWSSFAQASTSQLMAFGHVLGFPLSRNMQSNQELNFTTFKPTYSDLLLHKLNSEVAVRLSWVPPACISNDMPYPCSWSQIVSEQVQFIINEPRGQLWSHIIETSQVVALGAKGV